MICGVVENIKEISFNEKSRRYLNPLYHSGYMWSSIHRHIPISIINGSTMNKLLAKLKAYWAVISIVFTLLSSIVTGGWWLYGKIDTLNDKVNETASWVQDHDDDLKAQHDDITRLKEDERLREAGLLK